MYRSILNNKTKKFRPYDTHPPYDCKKNPKTPQNKTTHNWQFTLWVYLQGTNTRQTIENIEKEAKLSQTC